MKLLQCMSFFPLRTFYRYTNNTRLQVFQNATQIVDPERIRNVGIIAHIDAGKTTTVERMLYHAGLIRFMGNVDEGNTTMDYMEQERERGITITSAAITIPWNKHRINLIDTPGHVDFTIEVERSLRVLDGAVAILDASAGVETQSLTVWRQANRYHVPRFIYINKMDKPTADLSMCLDSIRQKFAAEPLLLQLPLGHGKQFTGIIDLLNEIKISSNDQTKFSSELLTKERLKLIEKLADIDDKIAELLLFTDKPISNIQLKEAICRLMIRDQRYVPVLIGSSLKNIGVQTLLDGIINFLPSARIIPGSISNMGTLMYIFKTIHDRQKQPLSFARIYSGSVKRRMSLINARTNEKEQIHKVFLPFADNMEDIDEIRAGSIAVLSGFKEASSGDILVSNKKPDLDTFLNDLKQQYTFLPDPGLEAPTPVFFCTIETYSESTQKQLDFALKNIKREDPSLRVRIDEQTGQTILLGMGELHIDIIRDRLKREYGLETYLGPLNVNYRETPRKTIQQTIVWNSTINERHATISITLSIEPIILEDKRIISFSQIQIIRTDEQNFEHLRQEHIEAINHGVRLALSTGLIKGAEVVNIQVKLHDIQLTGSISPALYSAAASDCVRACLRQADCVLLQPMMRVEVICVADRTQVVLDDLARRHSQIIDVQQGISSGGLQESMSTVITRTPLAELIGYSSTLRTLTSGQADFTLAIDGYEPVRIH
ncbi:unnamed protein product [Rotaria sp. Silwood1]|nr:unnamed protein product [Rotaria sp. Silwood1]CAF3629056.1 unnamed protein product [Rotaria sp. Silwood1]CAF3685058.1 unnamed protein product [Rotaria sp. Silwood1]CAF3757206.1 unnamed protein product [Rotaria sp. Silwood1]CAF4751845.1 unnamed protein product [Rotaria sp. Silwood1]